MKKTPIEIIVRGPQKSGKSGIAMMVASYLEACGYKVKLDPSIEDRRTQFTFTTKGEPPITVREVTARKKRA